MQTDDNSSEHLAGSSEHYRESSEHLDDICPRCGQPVSQAMIKEMSVNNGQLTMELEGGMCRVMAESFADQFIGSGAINYVEMSFTSKKMPGDMLVVTIQKASGKTPHQLRVEAESKLAELERSLAGE